MVFSSRHASLNLDTVQNELLNFDRDPARVKEDVVFTVNTIIKISGKSISSIRCQINDNWSQGAHFQS